jgi:hypothetical protein
LEVHGATPHPKKSVSSVQIGQRSANAEAGIGQSSGIALPEPFPGFSFELAVDVASNQYHQATQGTQEGEGRFGIAAVPDDQPGQMFFGVGVCSFGDEERHLFAISPDHQ